MIPSEEVQRQVARALVYGKKHRGRALKNKVDELGLKKHDRLEPSKKCGMLQALKDYTAHSLLRFFDLARRTG